MVQQTDEAQLDSFKTRVAEHGLARSILESFAYIKPFGGMFGKIVPFYAESYWYAMGGLTFLMFVFLTGSGVVLALLGPYWWLTTPFAHFQLVAWPLHLHVGHGREPLRPAGTWRLGVAVRIHALRRYALRPAVLFQPVQPGELHCGPDDPHRRHPGDHLWADPGAHRLDPAARAQQAPVHSEEGELVSWQLKRTSHNPQRVTQRSREAIGPPNAWSATCSGNTRSSLVCF